MAVEEALVFYEDLQVGYRFSSQGRTVTEADIVNFAGLSGDYNSLHVDAEYGRQSIFGERVAHGLLGLAMASGLFNSTELHHKCRKSFIALLSIESWRFLVPIKINDTVHLEVEISGKKETSNPTRGVVVFKRMLVNQKGEIVQEGIVPMLMARRKAD
jgi:acyl dehydratase